MIYCLRSIFMYISTYKGALKVAAINNPSAPAAVTEQNLCQLSRVRLLISFYEMLEKFMTNAFDGCSVALPLAPKVCFIQ